MKTQIHKITILSLLLFVCSMSVIIAQDKTASSTAEIKIKTSAQCEECKSRIEKAVNKLDGIEAADLDVESKVLTVTYQTDQTDPDEIRLAVSRVGYDADDVPANERAYKKLPKCCQKGGHE